MSKVLKSADLAESILEPVLDKGTEQFLKDFLGENVGDIAREVAVLKLGILAADIVGAAVKYRRAKKFVALYRGMREPGKVAEFINNMSEEEAKEFRAIAMDLLDKQSHDKQAEALGCIINQLAVGNIEPDMFDGVAYELRNVNPLAYNIQHSEFTITRARNLDWIIKGRVHYLPSSFVSNSSENGVSYGTTYRLTNLGRVFFKYAYCQVTGVDILRGCVPNSDIK